ncbi:MAG: hydrogenase expression protein HupH [Novosphingobium sp. SCN 66-18]|nr:MAG: hydrogenase expression protein HupH [Novosphingobium sp. SCN 66-18]
MRVMRVHLITPVITEGIRTLDDVAPLMRDDLVITQSLLATGPASIECEFDEAMAVPGLVVEAIRAERAGADAIVIDCMGDPGLKAAREVVSIPVLGPAQTAMHLAAMLGHRFSVVTVLDSVVPMIENLAKVYGVDEKLASVRVIDIPVLELETEPERLTTELAQASLAAVEQDGAHAIVLGCTGFLGCAEAIAATLRTHGHVLPVIDPVPATVCMADGMVRAGLAHSKRTYGMPRDKELRGYPEIGIARYGA